MTTALLRIDLNADLGEEHGDDDAIFPCLSSASIACGGHAGGAEAMEAALALAGQYEVVVGAHVGYEDRINFGRKPMRIGGSELTRQLTRQIVELRQRAAAHGLQVRYVKPHGALYHQVGVDQNHARALVDAVRATDDAMELLVPASTMLAALAGGIPCRHEFFADRGYHSDGRLVDRGHDGAFVHDLDTLLSRTMEWLETGKVRSAEGRRITVLAQSICLHGDSPFAVQSAQALHERLRAQGITISNWMLP
ncbi:MAG: 5-oxoprolinase subunit PxpA [Candidatus Nanopelagicales bacterium]